MHHFIPCCTIAWLLILMLMTLRVLPYDQLSWYAFLCLQRDVISLGLGLGAHSPSNDVSAPSNWNVCTLRCCNWTWSLLVFGILCLNDSYEVLPVFRLLTTLLHVSRYCIYDVHGKHKWAIAYFYVYVFRYNGRVTGNAYGPGTGPIWLDDVLCLGYEKSIANCHHRGWGTHNCNHQQDVSVACGSSSVQYGSLSCYHLSHCLAFQWFSWGRLAKITFCIFYYLRDLGDCRYWPKSTVRRRMVLNRICEIILEPIMYKMPIFVNFSVHYSHQFDSRMARRTPI